MHLTTAQQHLLAQTMESLLRFANRRLGVVLPDLGPSGTEDFRDRQALIARALWQHVELIDAFVCENPDHLSPAHVETARGLEGVLYDDFVYEGISHGRAVLLHGTGTYHAVGFDERSLERLPHGASCLRMALLPFQGLIVAAMPIMSTGVPSDSYREHLRKEASQRGASGPTSDGDVLAARARSYQKLHADRWGKQGTLPHHALRGPAEGFHTGALAGLAGRQRKLAFDAQFDLMALGSPSYRTLLEHRATRAEAFPLSLGEALELLDDDWLESIAQHFDDLDSGPSTLRCTLINELCERLAHDREQRDNALVWCEDAQFELLRKLVRTNPLPLNHLSPSETVGLYPMIPYVFLLHGEDAFVAWMPPEIARLVREVDLEGVARIRARLAQVRHAADALASMCGIISLPDAYERYRSVADDPLDQEHFAQTLAELECCDRRDTYALWHHEGTDYIVSTELSDASAIPHVIRSSYADRVTRLGASGAPALLTLADEDEDEFSARLDAELARLQRMRVSLLEAHGIRPAHDLAPSMLAQGFVDYLCETEALQSLRSYVDNHVPDDEDDYEFPDEFVRAVIVAALFEQDPYEDLLALVSVFGLEGCEGNGYPHTLGRLLTNAFNALPVWPLNGWSLEENTERLTGKRRRYRPDGTLIEDDRPRG